MLTLRNSVIGPQDLRRCYFSEIGYESDGSAIHSFSFTFSLIFFICYFHASSLEKVHWKYKLEHVFTVVCVEFVILVVYHHIH